VPFRQPLPGLLADRDGRGGHPPVAEEVLDERRAERRERVQRVIGGEPVDDVAHRVGGHQAGVVVARVRSFEVALEHDVDGQVAQAVPLRAASELDQAHL
jgi:hypothetical protein